MKAQWGRKQRRRVPRRIFSGFASRIKVCVRVLPWLSRKFPCRPCRIPPPPPCPPPVRHAQHPLGLWGSQSAGEGGRGTWGCVPQDFAALLSRRVALWRSSLIPQRSWGHWWTPGAGPHTIPVYVLVTPMCSEQGSGAEVAPGDVMEGKQSPFAVAWRVQVHGDVCRHRTGL